MLFDRDEAARLQKVNNMNDLELDSAEYLENTLAKKASYKAQKVRDELDLLSFMNFRNPSQTKSNQTKPSQVWW